MRTKVCKSCGIEKPITAYYSNQRKAGIPAPCMTCYNGRPIAERSVRATDTTLPTDRLAAYQYEARRTPHRTYRGGK